MAVSLKTEYWDDPQARDAFKKFMKKIFRLDFSEWESGGYWDTAYTPFSFLHGEDLVSSVCVYLLDAVIDGRHTHLAQISGVGTLPEWRGRGLSRRLTNTGLRWAQGRHDGVFLFADSEAVPFYRRCGFRPIDEYLETLPARTVSPCRGAVKLDPGKKSDRDRIYAHAQRRAPLSNRFSILNAKLLMFHALHGLRDHVYEIPDLNCLVFYKRHQGQLSLFDIVGEKIPRFGDLYPYLAGRNDQVIEFHFFTDKLGIVESTASPLRGNHPFVKRPFPVERPVFPYTSRA